jgi:cytochrome c oxidase assembly factor CtaG
VADLAAHWSLIALVTQRLILLLAVAPLLLLGLPYDIVQWLTRPRAVDAVLTRLSRPPVAIVVVTVLAVGSMVPVLVHLQSTSPLARGIEDGVTVVAGLVLWIPVLGRIPGIIRPRPVVRFGYLVAQAVTPAFLSFIYIFSRHPLYPGFAGSKAATGLQPLNDQQVAGFVSKLTMLIVLLTVGGVVLARTQATWNGSSSEPTGRAREWPPTAQGAARPGPPTPPTIPTTIGPTRDQRACATG